MIPFDWRFPGEVPGWLSEREGLELAKLAAGKRVLEIGSYHGRSTMCMAQVAESLDSIDWHKGDSGSGPGGTLDAFKDTIQRYDLREKITLHVECTQEAAPNLDPESFDLVFIDAAHDEENVRIDINAALRLVKPGGVIALHDWSYRSVQGPAKEILGPIISGGVDDLVWFQVKTGS